jgi:hypothetical protein
MSFVLVVDVVHVVSMGYVALSESVITLDPTERGVSCVMVLSSVRLARGCGTEM